MTDKIAPPLRDAFETHRSAPDHVERVIVTLAKGADPAVLQAEGVSIVSRMENLPIVIATIDAKGLEALSKAEGIERVEPDGTMRIPEDE